MFLTTHYLEEADALCDRLIIMDHSQIVIAGTPRQLKTQVAGDAVTVTVKDAPTAQRVLALTEPAPFVRQAGAEGTGVRLYVDDGSTALPELLRLLDAEQIPVSTLGLSEPTLDDVFLRQTGRSLRDTGTAGPETAVAA